MLISPDYEDGRKTGIEETRAIVSSPLDLCFSCGHQRKDHDEKGSCNYIKWIGGHPEYRCGCGKFNSRQTCNGTSLIV